jgi:hypothetical protein
VSGMIFATIFAVAIASDAACQTVSARSAAEEARRSSPGRSVRKNAGIATAPAATRAMPAVSAMPIVVCSQRGIEMRPEGIDMASV